MTTHTAMDSRSRVLSAIGRQRGDRPPTSMRFTVEALERMRQHLNVPPSDHVLQDVLDELDVDLRWLALSYIGPKERSTPTLFGEGTDFWGVRFTKIQTATNAYFEFSHHPLAGAQCVADIEHYDWPDLDWWDYDAVPGVIESINRTGRRAILFFAGGAFETPWYLRGLEQFLIDLYTQPEIAEAICVRVERYWRERALRVLDKAGGKIDIIGSGGDIGEQQRMLLDPQVWRTHIKPHTGRLIRTFKDLGLATFYHSDGSIVPVIDDFIELGLDLLDPVQTTAAGMTPEELFPRFGDRLSFHGAIDQQRLLPYGTADEVYRATRQTIDVLGQNGGYVVSACHQVQGDTPPENVLALLRAARQYTW